jgi:hypothetical protein
VSGIVCWFRLLLFSRQTSDDDFLDDTKRLVVSEANLNRNLFERNPKDVIAVQLDSGCKCEMRRENAVTQKKTF